MKRECFKYVLNKLDEFIKILSRDRAIGPDKSSIESALLRRAAYLHIQYAFGDIAEFIKVASNHYEQQKTDFLDQYNTDDLEEAISKHQEAIKQKGG